MDLTTLNKEQLAAVRHTEGPLLLLAGAGSGKTRVITYRIAYLLLEKGVPAESLLAMTFTNKAAREMQERVTALVGRRARDMVISTFHSLGVRLLREEIEKLGYKKNFSIYGTADQVRLVRDLAQQLARGDRKYDAERLLWIISGAKNRLLGPEAFVPHPRDDYQQMAAVVYPRYQKALKAYNAIDFDDILLLTIRLLTEQPSVLTTWQTRFRYMMVDEYQDTNAAQYQLLRLLCAQHRNLCVVGDDDQSIYGWRGADLGNILDFEKDYVGARSIRLEQNYRSSGNILAAANALIRHNRQRKEKALWTHDGPGLRIDLVRCQDEEEEASTVVERIQAERFRRQLPWSDFAILYRTNVQSRAFEEQLRYENVPYVLIGGQQFFDRKEVKDILAYFRVLVNPRDEVNLLRILNFPRRGIGETSADRLIRASAAQGRPLWEVLKDPAEVEELGEKTRAAAASFIALLEKYRQRFRRPASLAEVGRELLSELRMEEELFRTADQPEKGKRRAENVAEVLNSLAAYQEREGGPTLAGFLEKVSLLDRDDPGRGGKDEKLGRDAVVLMSLHSSKGLEFPYVFLVGLEEDYLPHRKSEGEGADVDEERRLCYVGITRARQKLTLSSAAWRKKFGRLQPREASRFLAELPRDLLDEQIAGAVRPAGAEEETKSAAHFFSGIKSLLDD
ncbi:MAG: UvrD-helicase domain-containing protein [Desulfuromonadales bacterium]|nr:UvrD-helicase domain-containing protein [Desulfuromonadales bacterium]